MCVGDIVLILDDTAPRNCWRKARVDEAYIDDDALVRKVRLTVADLNFICKVEDAKP